MKKILSLILIGAALTAQAVTPFYQQGFNSDGTPQTNPVVLQAYPPAVNGITIIGTNIIFGAYAITNTPNASGFFSNNIYGGTYKYTIPALSFSTFATIPETTNYASLSLYLTNSPVVGAAGGYAIITNWLGYAPFNPAAYQPATNNPGTNTIAYVSGVSGITNASGYVTNLSVTLTTNCRGWGLRGNRCLGQRTSLAIVKCRMRRRRRGGVLCRYVCQALS